VSVTPRPYLTPGKDPEPILQEAGWASGPVWTGAKNLVPAGIRSPDRPARRQSLYRLRYSLHRLYFFKFRFNIIILGTPKYRSSFRTKILYTFFTSTRATCPRHIIVLNLSSLIISGQWLRHYATNRQVSGSIPNGIIRIFQ